MPKVRIPRTDVSTDEVMEALRRELGDRYQVTHLGGSAGGVKVQRGGLAIAHVKPHAAGDATELHVNGVGFIVGLVVNQLGIARTVAAALERSSLATSS